MRHCWELCDVLLVGTFELPECFLVCSFKDNAKFFISK